MARTTSARALGVLLWAVAVAVLGTTLWLSFGRPTAALEAFPGADKVFHGLAYLALTGSWLLAVVWAPLRGTGPAPRAAWVVVAAAVVLGGGVEVIQAHYDRTADALDGLADAAGALVASLLWGFLARDRAERSPG